MAFSSPVEAVTIAEQTQNFGSQLKVFQVVQELGDNLNGVAGQFTFRVSTSQPNDIQFDYTAQNSRIYDKTTNTFAAAGCTKFGVEPSNPLRGLTFSKEGVPEGYEDVTIDFSCHNFSFIPGHRYVIFISNANIGNEVWAKILFGAAAYGLGGEQTTDRFTAGGLRYANGNQFDFANNSGSCDPIEYAYGSQTYVTGSGCFIFTSPQDDLYFKLTNTAPETKTPLILIPGIGGSELKVLEDTFWSKDDGHGGIFNHTYAKDEKVWVNEGEAALPGEDDYFDVLRMKTDGIDSEANLGLTGDLYAGAYQTAIDFFTSNGYTLNQDLFVFPYDWRMDLTSTAALLGQKIQEIKNQTGSEKVDIVAHSMGGLVARNYIADANRAQNVRKLFTLGTPHLGAVESLKSIVHGGCLTRLTLLAQFICLGMSPSEVKDVLQNMISGYELAPSQTYFNFYSDEDNLHPYPYRTSGTLNYSQIKDLLATLGHNTSLFNPSEIFHSIDSNLHTTNGVELIIIAGSGKPTLGQIIEEKTTSLFGIQTIHKDTININGDNTVPLFSASLKDPTKNLSLLGSAVVYYTNQKHEDLVTTGPALNLVKNILEGSNQIPSGVSAEPYKFTGTSLSVHSPVNIHVYDSNNNHTGPTEDGHFEANIPGSSYDTLDDAKFIYLPEDGVYNVKFEATNQGSFDFKIRKYEDDVNIETILYKEIPLTDNTKAETAFDTSSIQPPTINVDENGDGTSDFDVNPFSVLDGNANYDHTPPTISFDVNPKTIWPPKGEMVDINITGNITDENPYLTTILVDDEYNSVEPSMTIENQININQVIKLEASRKRKDKDGRKYTIKILVTDLAGNTSQDTFEVIVPHDQRNNR